MNIKKEIEFAGRKLVLETGKLAPRADMAVQVTYGDTVILATAVSGGPNPDLDYFPLQVGYEEKLYASGTIKSSKFVKRDGRPTDNATVTRRLIDRAIRPLFPEGFMDEVQVILMVLSLDENSDAVFASALGAAAALQASNIPFNGPMLPLRVGYINDDYVANPTWEQFDNESDLEMTVFFSGNDKKFLSIDAKANILPENKILGAIEFANEEVDAVLELLNDFSKEVNPNNEKYEFEPQMPSKELVKDLNDFAHDRIVGLLDIEDKEEYEDKKHELLEEIFAKFEGVYKKTLMQEAFSDVIQKAMVSSVFEKNKRHDGRSLDEVRPISSEVGLLPRTHGSALFNRGETQGLTIATLGNPSLELLVHDMYGERNQRYIHYYNFPPFSTGEVGRLGGAGGREIGHGMLAEKALVPVIPSQEEFPYVIILNTEILSSNGSSSMAATCGSSLALMDAGVPIKEMVGGIAMGLFVNEDQSEYLVITDLDGTEDKYGFMDFKMTGTKTGVTAIQADFKVTGIPMSLLPKVVEESKKARLHVIEQMEKTLTEPKTTLSKYAPKMVSTKVHPDQIGMIIGSGGKTIKEIQLKTGAEIGIEDDGTIFISSENQTGADEAKDIIEGMTREIKPGEIFDGVVEEVVDFGAFVEILPGRVGLLHVSEIANTFVKDVSKHLKAGDHVTVKVLEVKTMGNGEKISLSKKALEEK